MRHTGDSDQGLLYLTREDDSHISRLQIRRELYSILVQSSHVMIEAVCFQVTDKS